MSLTAESSRLDHLMVLLVMEPITILSLLRLTSLILQVLLSSCQDHQFRLRDSFYPASVATTLASSLSQRHSTESLRKMFLSKTTRSLLAKLRCWRKGATLPWLLTASRWDTLEWLLRWQRKSESPSRLSTWEPSCPGTRKPWLSRSRKLANVSLLMKPQSPAASEPSWLQRFRKRHSTTSKPQWEELQGMTFHSLWCSSHCISQIDLRSLRQLKRPSNTEQRKLIHEPEGWYLNQTNINKI